MISQQSGLCTPNRTPTAHTRFRRVLEARKNCAEISFTRVKLASRGYYGSMSSASVVSTATPIGANVMSTDMLSCAGAPGLAAAGVA
jgi:hypothetical protein